MRTTPLVFIVSIATLSHSSGQTSATPSPRPAYEFPVVYKIGGTGCAKVRENVKFGEVDGRELFVDVYQPADLKEGEQRAAIVFISGAEKVRSWPSYRDYGRLSAAQGFIGLVPDKRFPRGPDGIVNGTADTELLLRYLAREGATFGVDTERLALWHFSGGGQLLAVGLPLNSGGVPRPKCIVAFYALGDFWPEILQGNDALMEHSPARALESLGEKAPPIFVTRAGQDNVRLNDSIASFLAAGLKSNAPLTLINYPAGQHGFDTLNDTDESRAIIKAAFEFVQRHTRAKS